VTAGERVAPVTYLFGSGPNDSPPLARQQTASLQAEVTESPTRPRAARRAENISLTGLTRRNMSRWEVENLLTSRDLDEETVAAELERLERVGLIDDAALAETLVRTRRERKGLGYQALVAELRRRHIDQAIIDATLDDAGEDDDSEQQRANELAEKRAKSLQSYDEETAKRRLTGYLMRKGYSSSIVQTAVRHALTSQPRGGTSGVRFR